MPTVAGITFGTGTSYQVLASGPYQVRLTTAGTKTVVVDSGTLVVNGADVRTIIVVEKAGGGLPLQATVVSDAGT